MKSGRIAMDAFPMTLDHDVHVENQFCRDCQACTLACSLYHYGECNLSLARLRVAKDMASYQFEITLCRQCEQPGCLAACPNESIRLGEQGWVVLFEDECLLCGACAEACPYHAIFYNAALARYLVCDLCAGRLAGPACVEMCPVGALSLSASRVEEG